MRWLQWDFSPVSRPGEELATQLALRKGDIVWVLDRSRDDWWSVRLGDIQGYAPAAYMALQTPTPPSPAPAPAAAAASLLSAASPPSPDGLLDDGASECSSTATAHGQLTRSVGRTILKQGWLEKKGGDTHVDANNQIVKERNWSKGGRRNWKQRWFVLYADGELAYYAEEGDRAAQVEPKGQVPALPPLPLTPYCTPAAPDLLVARPFLYLLVESATPGLQPSRAVAVRGASHGLCLFRFGCRTRDGICVQTAAPQRCS
jgi:hypothetical protein